MKLRKSATGRCGVGRLGRHGIEDREGRKDRRKTYLGM